MSFVRENRFGLTAEGWQFDLCWAAYGTKFSKSAAPLSIGSSWAIRMHRVQSAPRR